MAFVRSLATVGGLTGISRVLGFARDVLIAAAVGTGPVADAFFVAFRLPNLFRRLFAEGAFNAAFVPLFAKAVEEGGRATAKVFAEQTLAVLLTVLLVLTATAMLAMPWLMHGLAPGFSETPEKFDLAVRLSRITFPYLMFMAVVALLGGVLNSLHRFAAAAAAPILLNVFFILSLSIAVPLVGLPGQVLAWTVAAAGIGQFLLLIVAASRAGMALRLPRPRLTPAVRRLLKLMLPGILSAGAIQINIAVGTVIASLQAGAVSYLYYADRVYQLPLGLIGIAFGVVMLPELARKLRAGADRAATEVMNRGLELSLLLTLPAAVALLVVPRPIVVVLFERGVFDAAASDATARALAAFALGLPAFVLVKILQTAFFAREDTVTPFRFAAVAVAVNIGLSLSLFWMLQHVGIALATAAAGWVNAALLAIAMRRRGYLALDGRFRGRLPRILLASAAMGVALWFGRELLADRFADDLPGRIPALAILVAAGMAIYGGLALGLRAMTWDDLRAALRRRA